MIFQVGRSSESPIDFVVMDTLPGDKKDAKVMQSTISRFACRILVNRCEPAKARIFAAGFDSSRNIFLGVSSLLLPQNLQLILMSFELDFFFRTGEGHQMAGQCWNRRPDHQWRADYAPQRILLWRQCQVWPLARVLRGRRRLQPPGVAFGTAKGPAGE